MAVAPLSRNGRDYVRAFDLTCIALWRDGLLGVSRNPTGAEAAWWCSAKAAGKVVRAANANGKDVIAAAARLHTPLTDHVLAPGSGRVRVGTICASVSGICRPSTSASPPLKTPIPRPAISTPKAISAPKRG
jgi:hypothetical protein